MWWFYTHPRCVLFPEKIKIAKSMRSYINQEKFTISYDQCFEDVITACQSIERKDQESTWIIPELKASMIKLHEMGYAHSIEVWHRGELAGGLYGIALGKCFFGESMFTRVADASKVALVELGKHLVHHGFAFIDCQVVTGHLVRMGAHTVSRSAFLKLLRAAVDKSIRPGKWCLKETGS